MMKQAEFTDSGIHDEGCYFLCLGRMHEIAENVQLINFEVTNLKSYLVNIHAILEPCNVVMPDKLFELLGSQIRQIGRDGEYWSWVRSEDRFPEFAIIQYVHEDNEHAVLALNTGAVIFNSAPDFPISVAEVKHKVYYKILSPKLYKEIFHGTFYEE